MLFRSFPSKLSGRATVTKAPQLNNFTWAVFQKNEVLCVTPSLGERVSRARYKGADVRVSGHFTQDRNFLLNLLDGSFWDIQPLKTK